MRNNASLAYSLEESLDMTTPNRAKKLHDLYEDEMEQGSQPSLEIYDKNSLSHPLTRCVYTLNKSRFNNMDENDANIEKVFGPDQIDLFMVKVLILLVCKDSIRVKARLLADLVFDEKEPRILRKHKKL